MEVSPIEEKCASCLVSGRIQIAGVLQARCLRCLKAYLDGWNACITAAIKVIDDQDVATYLWCNETHDDGAKTLLEVTQKIRALATQQERRANEGKG
jgi:hypothetical protein